MLFLQYQAQSWATVLHCSHNMSHIFLDLLSCTSDTHFMSVIVKLFLSSLSKSASGLLQGVQRDKCQIMSNTWLYHPFAGFSLLGLTITVQFRTFCIQTPMYPMSSTFTPQLAWEG